MSDLLKSNPNSLVRLLNKFNSGLTNLKISKNFFDSKIFDFLSNRGLIIEQDKIEISSYNKILIAIAAVENGADIMDVCKYINWKDFELFSSEIMQFHNYVVYNNYRLKNPTREIDVVGVKSEKALLVDCKHWKKKSPAGLKEIVDKQKNRGILFMEKTKLIGIKYSYPVIITFLPTDLQFVNNVPIVPISSFNSFLLEFDNYDQILFRV